jgi:hypothetical protein
VKKKRLLMLADFLGRLKPERFDLGLWACGSVACACGWAGRMPSFKKLGFTLSGGGYPMYRDLVGMEAAAKFFGLTVKQADSLFVSSSYRSGGRTRPKSVANRIRRLVEAS